jgi:hypothetical protein
MPDVPSAEIRPRSVRDIRSGKGFREPQAGASERSEHPQERVSRKKRFEVPYTFLPVPKTFFTWLPYLSGNEIKIYMAIGTHTLQFKKFAATIPMSELQRLTGLCRDTISGNVLKLEKCGLLKVSRAMKRVSKYEILTPPCVGALRHEETEQCVGSFRHEKAV